VIERYRGIRDPATAAEYRILVCRACGLGITDPRPRDPAVSYSADYYGRRHGFTAEHCWRRRLRWVKEAGHRERRLLDVGCGDGSFLLAASRAGWTVMGTELDPAVARAAGIPVETSIADVRKHGPFDVVTLWHSLEHMPDPALTLDEVRGVLADEGTILIAVPDFGGWQARANGAAWLHNDLPRHLFHFTDDALSRLLANRGLRVVRRRHMEFEYDVLGWSQSLMNRFLAPPNAFFDLLRQRKPVRGARAAAHFGVGVLLSGLALPLVAAGAAARRGGTLVVAAQT
jgi:SAM-dependent methyltransferase